VAHDLMRAVETFSTLIFFLRNPRARGHAISSASRGAAPGLQRPRRPPSPFQPYALGKRNADFLSENADGYPAVLVAVYQSVLVRKPVSV
jgi:hypothetical protein